MLNKTLTDKLFLINLHRESDKMKSLSVVSDDELQKYYKTISSNVKRIRKAHSKPQLDLVLEMGMKSTSFYSKCENAKDNHHFNLEHLLKISKVLKVDINNFFEGIETVV